MIPSFAQIGLAPPARAGALLAWLLAQSLEGYERSVKLSAHSLLDKRFLAGMAVADLPPAQLGAVCRGLEMPADLLADLANRLGDADIVHFGYEQGDHSAIFKIYLEFAGRLDAARASGNESFLLHRAFKWDAQNPFRRAVASYRCFPELGADQILARIARFDCGRPGHPTLDLAAHLIGLASDRGAGIPMYLEVSEEGNPRASFDLNLHGAELRLDALAAEFLAQARRFAIPAPQFDAVWSEVAGKVLGHVAGGTSRDGSDFLTIYYDPLS